MDKSKGIINNGNTTRSTTMTIINTTNHSLIILTICYIIYLINFTFSKINIHVLCCSIGYVLLMSESLMVLTTENIWSRNINNYRNRSHLHWILQAFGAIISITGVVIEYIGRNEKNKPHLSSIHSIVGFISIIIMIIMCLSGVTMFYTMKFKNLLRPVVVKFIHEFLGITCFTLGMIAECYGFNKSWMRSKAGDYIAVLAIILVMITTIVCIIRPIKSLLRNFFVVIRRN